jgi:uncharacterized OB-fold protein
MVILPRAKGNVKGRVDGADPCATRRPGVEVGDEDATMTMSDWAKVTRPIPVPNEWTKPFWDAAKRGVLALQRCQACGHFQHPPYATCVNCMAIDLKFEPVTGKGTIYAYTIMYHAGDRRFAAAIPYASIIVELDEAPGALLAGNLLEAPYTEAKVGRRVEVIFQPLNDDITLPQFRLAPDAPQG